ncbi:13077_t:CDS:2 [Funneliformis caledonium]|uniref:13077_t:CDS:1 n=1 Tax=Funneliformis caledonium TaxID=1117310 RepID=A0A9N9E8L1_9GLOM|nr:13077_t:CDS:2 [Funneliformis caledonium]
MLYNKRLEDYATLQICKSERFNNTPPRVSLTIEENIFGPQYERESEICSLCNKPDPLFKPSRANLEPVDDDARLNLQEEEDRVKKFFKEEPTTPDMVFVKLHNKILDAEKILKEKTREVSHAEYEILDSLYPLKEALEKKLAEFSSIHPLQTARIFLNAEIK